MAKTPAQCGIAGSARGFVNGDESSRYDAVEEVEFRIRRPSWKEDLNSWEKLWDWRDVDLGRRTGMRIGDSIGKIICSHNTPFDK